MNKLLAAMILTAGLGFAAQFSVGIRIGEPPRPRELRARPIAPGPGYNWVDGYWYPVGNRYTWHQGYWTRPPYEGSQWVGSRYENGMFYQGYWDGDHGRIEHDHQWDRDRDHRDYREDRR
jgi:WXXGXW repeat (2 copies)